jgi:hypothetical protein
MKRIVCLVAAIVMLAGFSSAQSTRSTTQGIIYIPRSGAAANPKTGSINADVTVHDFAGTVCQVEGDTRKEAK